jgi:hypothetical protein
MECASLCLLVDGAVVHTDYLLICLSYIEAQIMNSP